MNKLIRDIPDVNMRVIASKAAIVGKSTEAYIRDVIVREGVIHSDESAVDMILSTKQTIGDMLRELSNWFAPILDMDSLQVRDEIQSPVQALAALLYIKSDLIHALEMANKVMDTME